MNRKQTMTIASQDTIDQYEATATEFLKAIFDRDLSECLLTDESNLSDFATCGLPDARSYGTVESLYQAWDDWVVPRICTKYQIEHFSARIRLIELFRRIEARPSSTCH